MKINRFWALKAVVGAAAFMGTAHYAQGQQTVGSGEAWIVDANASTTIVDTDFILDGGSLLLRSASSHQRFFNVLGDITLTADGGTIGGLQGASASGRMVGYLKGPIGGAGGLKLWGDPSIRGINTYFAVEGANSYSGPTEVRNALVEVLSSTGLGNSSQQVDVWDGTISLFEAVDNPLSVNTFGVSVLRNTLWTNPITLQGGRLEAHSDAGGDVHVNGPISLIGGGNFRADQTMRIGGSITGNAAIILDGRDPLHIDSAIGSRGPIYVHGDDVTYLHQANTFINDVEISGGNLQLASDNQFRSLRIVNDGSLAVVSGHTLTLDGSALVVQSGSLDVQGQLTQMSHLRKIGLDHFVIDAIGNQRDADIVIDTGWLEVRNAAALGGGSGTVRVEGRDTASFVLRDGTTVERDIVLNNARGPAQYGGLRQFGTGTASLTGDLDLGDTGSFVAARDRLDLHGTISGGALNIRSRDASNIVGIMSDSHTYSGQTHVWQGQLLLGDDGRLAATESISISGDGALVLDNSLQSLTDRIADDVPVILQGGKLELRGGSESIDTIELGRGHSFISTPSGTLDLGELQRVDHGTVHFLGLGSYGGGTGQIFIDPAPTLTESMIGPWAVVSSSAASTDYRFAGYDATDGVVAVTSFQSDINAATASDHVLLDNSPIVTLTADRTIRSLVIDSSVDGTLDTLDLDGHRLTLASGGMISNVTSNHALANGELTASGNELVIHHGPGNPFTIGADIVDQGGTPLDLTKAGPGKVELNGQNSYSGTTTVLGGRLVFETPDAFPGSEQVFVSGGEFNIGGGASNTIVTIPNATITNNGLLSVSHGSDETVGLDFDLIEIQSGELNGRLVGDGTIVKNSPGLGLIQGDPHDYTGEIIVNDGILRSGGHTGEDQLGQATVKVMSLGSFRPLGVGGSNATVELHGGTLMAGNFPGSLVAVEDSTIALADYSVHGIRAESFNIDGVLSGSGDLRVMGPHDAALQLNNNNSGFSGNISVEGGTVSGWLDHGLGQGTVSVHQGGAVRFRSSQLFNQIDMVGGVLMLEPGWLVQPLVLGGRIDFKENTSITLFGDDTTTLGGTSVFHDGVMVTRSGSGGLLDFAGTVLVDGEATLVAAEGRIRLSGLIAPVSANSALHVLGGVAIDMDADIDTGNGNAFSVTVDTAPTVLVANRAGQTISGNGQIGNSMIVSEGASLSPGNSTGRLRFDQDLTWDANGEYRWELSRAYGQSGSPQGWDLLDIQGDLVVTATEDNPFVIQLTPLGADGEPGQPDDWDGERNLWLVAQAANIIGLNNDNVLINADGGFALQLEEDHFWRLHQSGGNLYVQLIPEPRSAIVLGIAMLWFLSRKRQATSMA